MPQSACRYGTGTKVIAKLNFTFSFEIRSVLFKLQ